MSVRAQRERHEQLERERAVLQMREAVFCVIAPAHVRRAGSSAVHDAVDEALAQIVAAGGHLGEPEQVKALWITCARRRLIDEQRSAELQHRDATPVEEVGWVRDERLRSDLMQPTEDARQEWRIREILSVLRGDQRRWAEAWYDEVLSGSRPIGAQPRGLPEALGWTASKTKSVSRRARMRMAAFIDERARGVVCDERRALFEQFVMTGRRGGGARLDPAHYDTVMLHLAGCEECWGAWQTHRRSMLRRCGAILALPLDGLASAAHALAAKLTCLAMNAYEQGCSLLGRLGIGGAAAAGGGAATIGAKATAVCVGVVCAATAGGELVGVIPPIPFEAPQETRDDASRPETAPTTAQPPAGVATTQAQVLPPPPPVAAPAGSSTSTTPAVAPVTPPPPVEPPAAAESPATAPAQPDPLETPGDLPVPRSRAPSRSGSGSGADSKSETAGGPSNCVPGGLGC